MMGLIRKLLYNLMNKSNHTVIYYEGENPKKMNKIIEKELKKEKKGKKKA